jgi:stage V sporulation protein SpoVS
LGTPHNHRSAPKGAAGAAAAMAIGREERAVWKMGVTSNKQKTKQKQVSQSFISPYGQFQASTK